LRFVNYSAAWKDVAFTGTQPTITAGNNYWLCAWLGENTVRVYYDYGASMGGQLNSAYGATPPTTISPTAFDREFSIYATYTVGSSGTLKSISNVPVSAIKSINGILTASLKSFGGLTF
jgi:hypothetical protein